MRPLPFRVKICGVTTSEDAAAAIGAGATAIGSNFFAGSKRHIDPLEAQNIARVDSRELAVVGVFVNHTVSEIASIVTHVEPTWIQLHGDEPPRVIKHVKEAVDLPVIRALRWGESGSAAIDEYLQACAEIGRLPDAVLIDAHKAGEYGGTGITADWEAIARWRAEKKWDIPLVLAGGLTPENVAEAIAIVRPDAVDTASGVESAPGKKDHARVTAFVEAATAAFAGLVQSTAQNAHVVATVTFVDSSDAFIFGSNDKRFHHTILNFGRSAFSSYPVLGDRSVVHPGRTATLEFCFAFPEAALKKVAVGAEFEIFEGRVVGHGRIIEVLCSES